jgi:hypothetical protein
MSSKDAASLRRSRLKALRESSAAKEDSGEHDAQQSPARPGWRRVAAAAGGGRRFGGQGAGGGVREGAGDFRARILSSLRDVGEDDELIEGTEVGRDNLEQLIERLDAADASGPGKKLAELVWGLLDPVETDSGLEFDPEGVAKLVSFLEQGPGPGRGPRTGGAGNRARGGRSRGGLGGGRRRH